MTGPDDSRTRQHFLEKLLSMNRVKISTKALSVNPFIPVSAKTATSQVDLQV